MTPTTAPNTQAWIAGGDDVAGPRTSFGSTLIASAARLASWPIRTEP